MNAPRLASRPRSASRGINTENPIPHSKGRAAFCAALFLFLFAALPVRAEEAPRSLVFSPRAGYTIRAIYFDRQNVFDLGKPEESGVVGHTGNLIHTVTTENTLRSELIFKEGDPYDPAVIEEAERLLRTRSYLTDVRIIAAVDDSAKAVDLTVHTRDQWSLIVGATFGGTSENSRAGLDFGDKNLLGRGQSLNYSLRTSNAGFENTYGFRDTTLFDSRYDLWVEHKALPLERHDRVRVDQPFYSLATESAHGVDTSRKIHAEPDWRWQAWRGVFWVGRGEMVDGSSLRSYLKFSFGEESVHEKTEPVELLRDNKLMITADIQNDARRYAKDTYIEKFRQTEDIPLGGRYTVGMGPRLMMLGSTTSDVAVFAGVSKWHRLGERDYFFSSAYYAKNDDQFNNNISDLQLRYYFRRFPYQSIVSRFQFTVSESETNFFKLGGTNGLRGYRTDEFRGRNQLLMNIEDRIFTYRDFFSGIFEPGFVVFADFGAAWYGMTPETQHFKRLYGGVGGGVRLALLKAPGISLVRLDYGVPLEPGRSPVVTIGMEGFF